MGADGCTETFKAHFAEVFEEKSLAKAQLGDCVRYQDLFRLRVGAEPRCQLNGGSKKVVMLLDRFACCSADSHLKLAVGICLCMLVQLALNLNCTSNRSCC